MACIDIDALAEYGLSEGVDGAESSLDVTVRAAAAIAEQYLGGGDRVAVRVLSPGGRVGISDVVAEDHLSVEARAERGAYVGCIAGALSRQEYLDGLTSAGFINPTVRFTHQTADGMHSAIIQATKPERSAR